MSLQRGAAPLRFIAVRLGIPELETVVRGPGIADTLRLTIQYHDGRHPDQIATLIKMQSAESANLTVHYRRATDKPLVLTYTIDPERFRTLNATLRKIGFDKLDDPADIPWYGADLWLVERAAANFHHDIIIAPDLATGIYADIVKLIRENLRESVRAINP